jgi:hypothetical protein
MLFYALPFTIVPLVLYNLFGLGLFGTGGATVWDAVLFHLHLPSGEAMAMTAGALIVILGLVVLFIEILKSTRTTAPTIIDHGASMVVFILYLVEFIVVPACGSATFLILMLIALVDVVGGFTITIRGSRRDYAIERDVSL